MSAADPIGHYDLIRSRREYVEQHRARTKPEYQPPRAHRITVNLKTGERTVESDADIPHAAPKVPAWTRHVEAPSTSYKSRHITQAQQIAAGRATFQRILAAVATAYGTTPGLILGRYQTKQLYEARYASYRLVRLILRWSSTTMAAAYGRKDHTAVLAALARADRLYQSDGDWRACYDAAHRNIRGPI